MNTANVNSSAQLSLFSQEEMGVKSTPVCGCTSRNRVLNYLKTREGLYRLITSYPSTMPFKQAVELAMVDFTRGRKEVAV